MNSLRRRIDRFCVLHPNFGIPNLMLYIVIGNIAFYLLSLFSSLNNTSFYSILSFSWAGLKQGQLWRLLSFSFLPTDTRPFWLLVSCYFYYWIGSTLEREWGTAKFTIYYLSGVLLTALGAVITSLITGYDWQVAGATYVNFAMFFAFATLYPDAQVLLFFFIPVKIKWMAILDACYFAYIIFFCAASRYWIGVVLPLVALLNFFVFFAPEIGRFAKREQTRTKQAAHFHNAVRQTQREQQSRSVRRIGSYPRSRQAAAAAAHSSRTLPVIRVVTLSSVFGVSCFISACACSESFRRYFSAIARACAQVEVSGTAGPLAIISNGSPRISLSTILNTFAGAQALAKRPPFTPERRLRMVFISTISAPLASSCAVISCSSSPEISGFSNRALPPPDSKNSTVSSGCRPWTSSSAFSVAAKLLASGTGCPAS